MFSKQDPLIVPASGLPYRDEAVERGRLGKSMLYDRNRIDNTQLYWLFDLADASPPGAAVECGVYLGGSFVTWAMVRNGRGNIYAVDNWSSSNIPGQQHGIFMANMVRYQIDALVMDMDSWLAPAQIEEPVAFCFIDANHGEDGFPKDLAAWPDTIMPGGIISFHDYDVWKPPVVVKRYIDPWYDDSKWEYLGLVGSLIAFRRR